MVLHCMIYFLIASNPYFFFSAIGTVSMPLRMSSKVLDAPLALWLSAFCAGATLGILCVERDDALSIPVLRVVTFEKFVGVVVLELELVSCAL